MSSSEVYAMCEVGDLVIGFYADRSGIGALEQVTDQRSGQDIVTRWREQMVAGGGLQIEVWRPTADFYYRRPEDVR